MELFSRTQSFSKTFMFTWFALILPPHRGTIHHALSPMHSTQKKRTKGATPPYVCHQIRTVVFAAAAAALLWSSVSLSSSDESSTMTAGAAAAPLRFDDAMLTIRTKSNQLRAHANTQKCKRCGYSVGSATTYWRSMTASDEFVAL